MPAPKKRKAQDLDFQMAFYEETLKNNPNFVDCLIALGEIYTKKGLHKEGLKIDKRLACLRPENPIVHYNLACSHSLLGDVASSLEAMKRAITLGYDDFRFMGDDPDLANLRKDERFFQLMQSFKKREMDPENAK